MNNAPKTKTIKDGTPLAYPIKFYMANRIFVYIVILGIFFITWHKMPFFQHRMGKYMLVLITVVGIILFVFGLYGLSQRLLGSPILLLTPEGLKLGRFFYAWSEINDISLIDTVRHSSYSGTGRKMWTLVIATHTGETRSLPLAHITLEGYQLSEKEIFHIIEQAFNKQPLEHKKITMGKTDYRGDTDPFYRRLTIIRFTLLIVGFIIAVIMVNR